MRRNSAATPADTPVRRQVGADKRTTPLPPVSAPVSDTAITLGRLGIVVTVLAWLTYLIVTIVSQLVNNGVQSMTYISETIGYVVIVSFLTASSLLYLVARQGALYRTRAHRRVPRALLEEAFDTALPTMTTLIPSYREEIGTIRKTMLSAALQEYPFLRVVLLLDDPPNPGPGAHLDMLTAARGLAAELQDWLSEPAARFEKALETFETSTVDEECGPAQLRELAAEYHWGAQWMYQRADEEEIADHVDTFFADQVLRSVGKDFMSVRDALMSAASDGATLTRARMVHLYRRLAWTFRAEITWFERKLYASLSHEANKAMNLNSYIGIMGKRFEAKKTPEGVVLAQSTTGSIEIPDADFLLTLDADSVLLPDYCLRLVYLMMQPENHRLAVAQTPYSAFPGSSTRMERLAGATTDLQHIVHQGMSYHNATFWVGANAVIRKRAIDDIVEIENEGGHEIRRYVQDRTVIEDTESSLDLAVHGWWLLNYPERLSYSATPPDFGSLAIQRRRWANGGLLILPKLGLNARARAARGEHGNWSQTMLRINYMASTCWSSIGLMFLLAFPFDSKLLSPLVVLAALPYFTAMASDLHRCGYKRTDILRIYGFNLILLPVNLAGVFKSIQQAVTGKKIPFARTPKVSNRTATPFLFALSPLVIIAYSAWIAVRDYHLHNWGNAAFAAINATAASYAVMAFMGLKNTLVDIWLGINEWLHVSSQKREPVTKVRKRAKATPAAATQDWRDVLYRGAAATDSGMHHSAEGSFKILAVPPTAPPQHNRRASDQSIGADGTVQFNRRASDRQDRRASDRRGGPELRGSGDRREHRSIDRRGERSGDQQPVGRHSDENKLAEGSGENVA